VASLQILLEIGLREHFAALHQAWESGCNQTIKQHNEDYAVQAKHFDELLEQNMPLIRAKLAQIAYTEFEKRYPYVCDLPILLLQ
jgi:hypothetical protein